MYVLICHVRQHSQHRCALCNLWITKTVQVINPTYSSALSWLDLTSKWNHIGLQTFLRKSCGIQSSRKVASSAGLNQLPLRLPSLCMLCLAGVGDSLYPASLLIFNNVMRSSVNSHELRRYVLLLWLFFSVAISACWKFQAVCWDAGTSLWQLLPGACFPSSVLPSLPLFSLLIPMEKWLIPRKQYPRCTPAHIFPNSPPSTTHALNGLELTLQQSFFFDGIPCHFLRSISLFIWSCKTALVYSMS